MPEYYTARHDGIRLTFTPATGGDVGDWADYRSVWRMGDAENLWCEARRAPRDPGGVVIVRDFDEELVVVHAPTHLAFVETLGHFARLVTYGRYAADIYEHDED